MRHALSLATLGAAFALAVGGIGVMPAAAQTANTKILEVFGNDPCPTSERQEIVVCRRKPESERFRIPSELRRTEVTPGRETWTSKQQSLQSVGAAGAGTCSVAGAGSETGCWSQQMRAARAERRQKAQADGDRDTP